MSELCLVRSLGSVQQQVSEEKPANKQLVSIKMKMKSCNEMHTTQNLAPIKNHILCTPSKVGKCFLDHADSMRTAYTQYCLNHDKAEQLLEKFEALPEMQKVSFHILQMLIRLLS